MSLDLRLHFGLVMRVSQSPDTRTYRHLWRIREMDALIGYTGFVGSYLIRDGMDVYNSSNIQDIRGKAYRTVYCAGVYAEKWKANRDPETDKACILRLQDVLGTVICKRFVLISTVDVYDCTFPQDEEPDCCPNAYATHPYGSHRREIELWAQRTFQDVFIFRLPALFGHGLKKNALYDLIHDNQISKLRSDWSFQWYWLGWLRADIDVHMAKGHRIVNLVTPPVRLDLLRTLFFPTVRLSTSPDCRVSYRIGSRYGYVHSLEDVLGEMARYVRPAPSRGLVSELAWSPEQDALVLPFLRTRGIVSREIVPSKRNWRMSDYSNVYSAQSILYGVDIQIFQEPKRFLAVLQHRLADLQHVGCKVIVFGSPKQRVYSGEDAVGLFRKVGDMARDAGILFCLENNSRVYGGNWMTTLQETVAFVEEVNHPNVCVNLDTGSMIAEGETIVPPTQKLGHVQVSFPGLVPWDSRHEDAIRSILMQLSHYTGRISFETNCLSFTSIESFLSLLTPFQTFP